MAAPAACANADAAASATPASPASPAAAASAPSGPFGYLPWLKGDSDAAPAAAPAVATDALAASAAAASAAAPTPTTAAAAAAAAPAAPASPPHAKPRASSRASPPTSAHHAIHHASPAATHAAILADLASLAAPPGSAPFGFAGGVPGWLLTAAADGCRDLNDVAARTSLEHQGPIDALQQSSESLAEFNRWLLIASKRVEYLRQKGSGAVRAERARLEKEGYRQRGASLQQAAWEQREQAAEAERRLVQFRQETVAALKQQAAMRRAEAHGREQLYQGCACRRSPISHDLAPRRGHGTGTMAWHGARMAWRGHAVPPRVHTHP